MNQGMIAGRTTDKFGLFIYCWTTAIIVCSPCLGVPHCVTI